MGNPTSPELAPSLYCQLKSLKGPGHEADWGTRVERRGGRVGDRARRLEGGQRQIQRLETI